MTPRSRPRPVHGRRRSLTVVAAAITAAVALAGCSGGSPSASSSASASSGRAVSAARCTQNTKAGTITYVTGYQYQASASILDVIAAAGLGYFKDECLTVVIKPGTGDTSANAKYVAAGTAQMTDLGGQADLLTAAAAGIKVTGIATFGHVPIETLMTMPTITKLPQLDGTTLGQKGQLPPSIAAMLVKEGVDLPSIKQVVVGYDPSVLPRGQVQSLTGYQSNEPLTLAAAGTKVKTWDPGTYGIPGSFGTVVVNPAFAKAHPHAVQDFLRASLHATAYCQDHAATCVGYAAKLSQAGYDTAHNLEVWKTESGLVKSSTPKGDPVGQISAAEVKAEGTSLVANGGLTKLVPAASVIDPSYLDAVYDGTTLVWPAK